jgi:hypothetical protein
MQDFCLKIRSRCRGSIYVSGNRTAKEEHDSESVLTTLLCNKADFSCDQPTASDESRTFLTSIALCVTCAVGRDGEQQCHESRVKGGKCTFHSLFIPFFIRPDVCVTASKDLHFTGNAGVTTDEALACSKSVGFATCTYHLSYHHNRTPDDHVPLYNWVIPTSPGFVVHHSEHFPQLHGPITSFPRYIVVYSAIRDPHVCD